MEGWSLNRVLVDGGTTVNLVPKSMLGKLGKTLKDLVQTNVAMTYFNGKTSTNTRVRNVNRPTMFVVVPSKASYNLLLGRD